LFLACLLGSSPVLASDYVGLWKVDGEPGGIALSFPDNGFSGACLQLSHGGNAPGEIKVESQIVWHRFDSVSMVVDGALDPQNVHVQVSVKGKTVWAGDTFYFEQFPLELQLDGYEFSVEAKKIGSSDHGWTISFCGMEFMSESYLARFTSDCAGFDFAVKDNMFKIAVDEDWFSLKREMVGGFSLISGSWGLPPGISPINLEFFSSYPNQLFYVALALDDKPVLELETDEPKYLPVDPTTGSPVQFVVRAKGPVIGQMEWYSSLNAGSEAPRVVSPESASSDILYEPVEVAEADSSEESGAGGSGCASGPVPTDISNWLCLLICIIAFFAFRKCRIRGSSSH